VKDTVKRFRFDKSHIQIKKHPIWRIAMHNHEYYETELLLEGKGFSIINGVSQKASRGTLTFVSVPDVHGYELKEDSMMIHVSFSYDKIKNPEISRLLKESKSSVVNLDEDDIQKFTSLHEILSEELKSNSPMSEMIVNTTLESIVLFILKRQTAGMLPKTESSAIEKAINYINEHFTDGCTLSEVSDYIFMSDEHFSRKFHAETGVRFNEYLTAKRLEHSKRLLANGKYSIQDVAFESGFNSARYFSEAFKKHFGYTPSEYRKTLIFDRKGRLSLKAML